MYPYYYQTGFGYRLTSGVKKLIIVNGIIFILQLFFLNQLIGFLGLIPIRVFHEFMLWQIFTYMFLHGDVFHILFNMLALWMFGTNIEAVWGTKRFVHYYFLTGIGGGIATCLLSPNATIPSIGASAAIFGILVAYGMMFPDNIILLFGLFPMKARYFVILFGIIEFFACIKHTPDGIGHFAHLGGMVVGYLYLKNILSWEKITRIIAEAKNKRKEKTRENQKIEVRLIKERIDTLLDKISSEGMDSLTKEEKEFLKKASNFLQEHNL
ncbi:MAG: rhomboid family intramembrane serine protease [bacterium]